MAKKTFEKALKDLEDIVDKLENADLPIEQALKIFEDGMKLSNYCSDVLNETEKKIEILIKDNSGNVIDKKPFGEDMSE